MAVAVSLNYSSSSSPRLASPCQPALLAHQERQRRRQAGAAAGGGAVAAGSAGSDVRLACANGTRTAPGKILWRGQCIEEAAVMQVRNRHHGSTDMKTLLLF